MSAQALVAWNDNLYSVPPALARAQVTVPQRLGADHLAVATVKHCSCRRHASI